MPEEVTFIGRQLKTKAVMMQNDPILRPIAPPLTFP